MRIYFVAFEGLTTKGPVQGNCQIEIPQGGKFRIKEIEKALKEKTGTLSTAITFYKLMPDEEVFE